VLGRVASTCGVEQLVWGGGCTETWRETWTRVLPPRRTTGKRSTGVGRRKGRLDATLGLILVSIKAANKPTLSHLAMGTRRISEPPGPDHRGGPNPDPGGRACGQLAARQHHGTGRWGERSLPSSKLIKIGSDSFPGAIKFALFETIGETVESRRS
jgi:hypothetical protein